MSGFSLAVKLAGVADSLRESAADCIMPLMLDGTDGPGQSLRNDNESLKSLSSALPFSGEAFFGGEKPDLIKTSATPNGQAGKVNLTDCLACSGCVTAADVLLLDEQSVDKFEERMREIAASDTLTHDTLSYTPSDTTTHDTATHDTVTNDTVTHESNLKPRVVVSISGASEAALMVKWKIERKVVYGKLRRLFRRVWPGVKIDVVSSFLAEQIYEVSLFYHILSRLAEDREKRKDGNGASVGRKIFGSHCPGWVLYAEKGGQDLKSVAPLPSSLIIQGMLIKWIYGHTVDKISSRYACITSLITLFPQSKHVNSSRSLFTGNQGAAEDLQSGSAPAIFHVFVASCFDKKIEVIRPEFSTKLDMPLVDFVLGTNELISLCEAHGEGSHIADRHSLIHQTNPDDHPQHMTQEDCSEAILNSWDLESRLGAFFRIPSHYDPDVPRPRRINTITPGTHDSLSLHDSPSAHDSAQRSTHGDVFPTEDSGGFLEQFAKALGLIRAGLQFTDRGQWKGGRRTVGQKVRIAPPTGSSLAENSCWQVRPLEGPEGTGLAPTGFVQQATGFRHIKNVLAQMPGDLLGAEFLVCPKGCLNGASHAANDLPYEGLRNTFYGARSGEGAVPSQGLEGRGGGVGGDEGVEGSGAGAVSGSKRGSVNERFAVFVIELLVGLAQLHRRQEGQEGQEGKDGQDDKDDKDGAEQGLERLTAARAEKAAFLKCVACAYEGMERWWARTFLHRDGNRTYTARLKTVDGIKATAFPDLTRGIRLELIQRKTTSTLTDW